MKKHLYDVRSVYGEIIVPATAGAGTDNVKLTTGEIDRVDATTLGLARSAIVQVTYKPNLAAGETLSLTIGILDCAASSGSYSAATALLAKTAVKTGASTAGDVYELRVDLTPFERFIKFEVTPDLGASGTDTLSGTVTVALLDNNIQPTTPNIT